MITTKELAKIAGVSQSTVSRSLNNNPDISRATREKIQKLAHQHGYIYRSRLTPPRASAEKNGIGIIMSDRVIGTPLNLYLETLFNALFHLIDQEGYYPILILDRSAKTTVHNLERVIRTNTVNGCIIINTNYNHAIEHCLSQHKIPRVYTQYFARAFQRSLNIVDADHFTGGYLAVKHLISLGHKRIATFTHKGCDFEDRTSGYIAALKEHDIFYDPELVFMTDTSFEGGYSGIMNHWDVMKSVTALFAQTDMIAIGSIARLTERGMQIPRDFSVVGFDGLDNGVQIHPKLTTIEQPIAEIAKTTINRLIRLMHKRDDKATHSFVQPKLLIRNSTSAPNS